MWCWILSYQFKVSQLSFSADISLYFFLSLDFTIMALISLIDKLLTNVKYHPTIF